MIRRPSRIALMICCSNWSPDGMLSNKMRCCNDMFSSIILLTLKVENNQF